MKYSDHQISQYLCWKMPLTERQEFEAALTTNQDLATRVVIHKHLRDDIAKAKIREQLQEETLPERRHNPFMRTSLMAASIVILLGIGFWLYPKAPQKPHIEFTENYSPYPRVSSPEMGPTSPQSFLNHCQYAMMAYEAGKYKEALDDFKSLQPLFPQNDSLHFYMGITFIELQQSDSAIFYFEQILSDTESEYMYDAQWYKLLAYLQANQVVKAQRYLAEIAPLNNHKYRKLLEELRTKLP